MKKQPTDYQPISCSFYDELEIRAMHGSAVQIEYQIQHEKKSVIARIKTLETRNGEEFLVLENGDHIRLDYLISIDGVSANRHG